MCTQFSNLEGILELERDIEDLRAAGLTEEEIEGYIQFYIEFYVGDTASPVGEIR